jgi:hypothetical protein
MGGLGSPFNYKVITGNMPSLFEKRLNKAMEDGCTVLQSTFRVARGDNRNYLQYIGNDRQITT